MVEKLKLQILHYKRARFGASSERLKELAQLELLVEELESEYFEMRAFPPQLLEEIQRPLAKEMDEGSPP